MPSSLPPGARDEEVEDGSGRRAGLVSARQYLKKKKKLVFILSQSIKICTDWAREMVGKAAGTSA